MYQCSNPSGEFVTSFGKLKWPDGISQLMRMDLDLCVNMLVV